MTRCFCPRCGTALGTLDDPSVFQPRVAIFTTDKQPFRHIPEGLPAFERRPG